MLYLALYFPHFAFDCALRQRAEADAHDTQAMVLLKQSDANQRASLCAVNAIAAAYGLHIGQSLVAARALLGDFITLSRDLAAERCLRELLLDWAYRLSSMVCAHDDDTLILEIGGSATLLGSFTPLQQRIRKDLHALGLRVQLAAAPSIKAAIALAKAKDGMAILHATHLPSALADIPLWHAGFSDAQTALLQGLGLRKLQQVWKLPRADLAARTGHGLLLHLDQLLALQPDTRTWFKPSESFHSELNFDYEIDLHSNLYFPIKRLLHDLAQFLRQRDAALQTLTLELLHAPRQQSARCTRLVIGVRHPLRDADQLFNWARLKLENHFATEAPLLRAEPVRGLRVHASELLNFQAEQSELYDASAQKTKAQAQSWDQLADTLRTRLGNAALFQLDLHADPRPEHNIRPQPELKREPVALPRLPRPSWLLPRPIPLRDHVTEIMIGPERIESGWWDESEIQRDYYIVRTALGQCAWVFRPAGIDSGPWMLHGWFA